MIIQARTCPENPTSRLAARCPRSLRTPMATANPRYLLCGLREPRRCGRAHRNGVSAERNASLASRVTEQSSRRECGRADIVCGARRWRDRVEHVWSGRGECEPTAERCRLRAARHFRRPGPVCPRLRRRLPAQPHRSPAHRGWSERSAHASSVRGAATLLHRERASNPRCELLAPARLHLQTLDLRLALISLPARIGRLRLQG
mmetsp:Transcript_40732/g.131893  ORF Transcript_40732/g.131893 Transcript_40732/m.131893 type:complete len:204 (-) Transcript_40732:2665-3276(-)